MYDREHLIAALSRVANGDKAGLKTVYDLTSAKLLGICARILKEQDEAEDVLQEVYVSVWSRAGSFDRERSSPITWLATIARNRAIDRLRSRRVRPADGLDQAEQVADASPDAFTRVSDAQEAERLRHCMDGLETTHRKAIRAAFFDGLAYSHLALRDNVPLGTMKSWIRRGLLQLKGCLSG
ncbi:sigma-70 family RNA polymerase sigma factor [Sphingomonas piscis]|uniref:RNA polymerase sigma factor n=1 Tax=Sphingomonas piscis TaxID=2714943 RepID=A0A6G7YRI7_9SPHN|nr:sigma-70 family RNA polymerase sigma factor [Sphingomonas piscis]QIK79353.1 sigma-70 family RNA polymerase sigma factor [Sphingomonas piscis]